MMPTGDLLRRFALMLSGEVLQSTFHFALNLALVPILSPHDYGVFAIAFLAGGIGVTYIRALAGVPISTFLPPRLGRRTARALEVTFGSGAIATSALIGAVGAAALLAVPEVHPFSGGLLVGLWCLRSYLRFACFARRRTLEAAAGDLAFAIAGSGFVFALVHGPGTSGLRVDSVLLALAGAHVVGICVSLIALREPVRVSFGTAFRRRYRALAARLAWSLLGVTTNNVQGQGQTLVVALVSGPQAYAPIAATLVLFAPLRLTATVLVNMALPEIAAHLGRGDEAAARRLVRRVSALILAGCLLYGGLIFATLPTIDAHLFAGRFSHEPLELIATLLWGVITVSMTYAAPRALLEAQQAFRFLAGLSAAGAVIGLSVVTTLLLVSTPAWSILGLLMSETIVLVGCVWRLARTASPPTEPIAVPSADGHGIDGRGSAVPRQFRGDGGAGREARPPVFLPLITPFWRRLGASRGWSRRPW